MNDDEMGGNVTHFGKRRYKVMMRKFEQKRSL
jgi:hypothetical protein